MPDDEVAKAEDIVREALWNLARTEAKDFGRSPGMDAFRKLNEALKAFPVREFWLRGIEPLSPPVVMDSPLVVNWATVPYEGPLPDPIKHAAEQDALWSWGFKAAKNKRRARARQRARELRRSAGGNSPAATALPAPAPATAGEPGLAAWNERQRVFADDVAGLVPLPEKPKPVERPFVPRKIGEF